MQDQRNGGSAMKRRIYALAISYQTLYLATFLLSFLILYATLIPALAGGRPHPPTPINDLVVPWAITETRIVSDGVRIEDSAGVTIRDYTIKARAISADPAAPFDRGHFRATLTFYSPAADRHGRQQGRWYVSGNWEINGIDRLTGNPLSLRGSLYAPLSYDPLRNEKGHVDATVRLNQNADPFDKAPLYAGNHNFDATERFEGIMLLPQGR